MGLPNKEGQKEPPQQHHVHGTENGDVRVLKDLEVEICERIAA